MVNFLKEKQIETQGKLEISEFTEEKMNKLAFMCATGSGKTLIMHIMDLMRIKLLIIKNIKIL